MNYSFVLHAAYAAHQAQETMRLCPMCCVATILPHALHLDVAQGASEARSEPYKKYGDASTGARQRSDTPRVLRRNPIASGWQAARCMYVDT